MSSTTTPTSSATDSSVSASSSSSTNVSNPGMFYKNLFYILIGLLCAFAIVSFLSLARARRRRNAILREAQRLGVVVPGIPGYIPMRDRASLLWSRADGSNDPDWWEVEKARVGGTAAEEVESEKRLVQEADTSDGFDIQAEQLSPLAIIPAQVKPPVVPPVPVSHLPYFPNHLAYRPDSIVPPTARFASLDTDTSTLDQLAGERIEVVTVIKMPVPTSSAAASPRRNAQAGEEEDEGEEVIREWGGIELGTIGIKVRTS